MSSRAKGRIFVIPKEGSIRTMKILRLTARGDKRTLPRRVRVAVLALWGAWLLSAVALFVNQVLYHGAGIGPGPAMGVLSLAVQAGIIWFVRRGGSVARALVVLFLVLAALPLGIVPRLTSERAVYSAGYLVGGFLLKAVASWLLFTGDATEWFARGHRGG